MSAFFNLNRASCSDSCREHTRQISVIAVASVMPEGLGSRLDPHARVTMTEEDSENLYVLNLSIFPISTPASTGGRRRISQPVVAVGLLLLLLIALPVAPARAQSDAKGSRGAPSPEPPSTTSENPLDVDLLLSDPVRDLPPFQSLRQRMRELASGEGSPEAFRAAAEDLASDGIYAAAIQVLWFGSKMVDDEAKAASYSKRMKVWARAALPADELIEEGQQLQVADRNKEAIETYLRAVAAHPFNERAHFSLADAWRSVYLEEYGDDLALAPLEIRVRLFRDAYVHYRLALEIDPLFYDAHYGLSELRDLFPDNHEVLLKTQFLTQRALDFRGEVLPVLGALEQGETNAATFEQLGDGLTALGESEYAVFAWRCALKFGASEEEIGPRIEAVLSGFESDREAGPERDR